MIEGTVPIVSAMSEEQEAGFLKLLGYRVETLRKEE